MHYGTIIYFVVSLLIGLLGMNRKLGFFGYFFGSLALTPLLGIILLFASDPARAQED